MLHSITATIWIPIANFHKKFGRFFVDFEKVKLLCVRLNYVVFYMYIFENSLPYFLLYSFYSFNQFKSVSQLRSKYKLRTFIKYLADFLSILKKINCYVFVWTMLFFYMYIFKNSLPYFLLYSFNHFKSVSQLQSKYQLRTIWQIFVDFEKN